MFSYPIFSPFSFLKPIFVLSLALLGCSLIYPQRFPVFDISPLYLPIYLSIFRIPYIPIHLLLLASLTLWYPSLSTSQTRIYLPTYLYPGKSHMLPPRSIFSLLSTFSIDNLFAYLRTLKYLFISLYILPFTFSYPYLYSIQPLHLSMLPCVALRICCTLLQSLIYHFILNSLV